MSESATNPSGEVVAPRETITCTKCGAENRAGAHRCGGCDAHLYVRCYHCRERVERSLLQCPACGKMMKAPALWRFKRSLRGGNAALLWMVPTVILFLVLGILIANHFAPAVPPAANAGKNPPPVHTTAPPVVDQGAVTFPTGR